MNTFIEIKNKKIDILTWISLLLMFLVTRLYNLKIIPIFTDEAIYSYWAQVALHDPANRVMSLEDGKQPLFIWLAAISQQFVQDPLIATRLASVFAGLGSLIGIYLLARELFGKAAAKIAAALYILLPFTLLYDRMALYDSLLSMLGIWAILLSVKVARRLSLDFALLNGIVIGLATITKSSGNFFLYVLPFSVVFLNFKEKLFRVHFFKWIFFSVLAVIISQLIYNSLRLFPLFYLIARKNHEFIRTFDEIIKNPLEYSLSNFQAIIGWLISYIGLPLFLIFLLGLIYGFLKKDNRIFYIAALIFVPFFAEVIFNKVLYPRFILFYYPYVVLIIAYAFAQLITKFISKKNFIVLLLFAALALPAYKSLMLLTSPTRSLIPDADASQYLNSWPAGYGVEEVITFLKKESKYQEINVATEGTFGLFPFSLNIYFYANHNVHIYSFWPVNSEKLPQQILELSKDKDTYFIFNENQREIINPHLKFLQRYQKGSGDSYMRLYKILP